MWRARNVSPSQPVLQVGMRNGYSRSLRYPRHRQGRQAAVRTLFRPFVPFRRRPVFCKAETADSRTSLTSGERTKGCVAPTRACGKNLLQRQQRIARFETATIVQLGNENRNPPLPSLLPLRAAIGPPFWGDNGGLAVSLKRPKQNEIKRNSPIYSESHSFIKSPVCRRPLLPRRGKKWAAGKAISFLCFDGTMSHFADAKKKICCPVACCPLGSKQGAAKTSSIKQ